MEGEGEIAAPAIEAPAPVEAAEAPAAPPSTEAPPVEAAPADTPAPSTDDVQLDAPVEVPLWSDEQWTGWDGSRDSLDDRYHQVYDRQAATHTEATAQFERQIREANESIEYLTFGAEVDPQLQVMRDQIAGHDTALSEATTRAETAEARIQEIQNASATAANAERDGHISDFTAKHAWAFEPGANKDVNSAISALIGDKYGVVPVAAGDLFLGKPAAYQAALAAGILRGDSVETAMELAKFRTAAPAKPKVPPPLTGTEFVNGSDGATTASRRPRNINDADSAKEARGMMADAMFNR